jgi:hypothetical protein
MTRGIRVECRRSKNQSGQRVFYPVVHAHNDSSRLAALNPSPEKAADGGPILVMLRSVKKVTGSEGRGGFCRGGKVGTEIARATFGPV